MNKICAKVYYDIVTGTVLAITSEFQGFIRETTKEEDMKMYSQLSNRKADNIDFIKLEYGTFESSFTNAKSYQVDLQTKKLEIEYYTAEELEAQRKQYEKQIQKEQATASRMADIAMYFNTNTTILPDVEDLILKSEQNKILNGGM